MSEDSHLFIPSELTVKPETELAKAVEAELKKAVDEKEEVALAALVEHVVTNNNYYHN